LPSYNNEVSLASPFKREKLVSTITIPSNLREAFAVKQPTRICDESGNVLGYYTPRREATEEDYEWAMKQFTPEQIEAAERSGPGRPASEIIPELIRKYGL
jgi:hypothetical protein